MAWLVKEQANGLGCNDQKRGGGGVAGQLPANAFGLSDMAGNAAERGADCLSGSYRSAPRDGNAGAACVPPALKPAPCRRQ